MLISSGTSEEATTPGQASPTHAVPAFSRAYHQQQALTLSSARADIPSNVSFLNAITTASPTLPEKRSTALARSPISSSSSSPHSPPRLRQTTPDAGDLAYPLISGPAGKLLASYLNNHGQLQSLSTQGLRTQESPLRPTSPHALLEPARIDEPRR